MSQMKIPEDLYRLREEKRVHLSGKQRMYLKVRRLFEFCVALVAAIVLLIPFLLVAIAQKISSPHEPIFFLQERVGKNDRPFKIIKFRSMKTSAPKSVATGELENPEMYVSKLGNFLRRTSIDEMPQIYNVLLGQMSIVGPRPLIPEEEEIQFLRWYYGIYAVPPGITGLAQINGRDFVDLYDKVYYDREYVKHIGLMQDVKIILKSIVAVLGRMGIRDGNVEQSEKTSVALYMESTLREQFAVEEENTFKFLAGK